MKRNFFTSLGIMSGTSMDGLDLSLIKSDGYNEYTSILDDYFEFDVELRKNLIDLRSLISSEEDLNKHSQEITDFERKFTFYFDYPAEVQLLNIKSEAHDIIFERITQDIFNASLAKW